MLPGLPQAQYQFITIDCKGWWGKQERKTKSYVESVENQ